MTSSPLNPPATTNTKPDLPALYAAYLSAFNAHSWPSILQYLSPTCHATVRGTLVNKSAEEMRPNYQRDFDRCERHEIVIREMVDIERSGGGEESGLVAGAKAVGEGEGKTEEEWKKGIRWGLKCTLWDPTMDRTIVVNYWWRLEEGRWMQCWHEILGSVPGDVGPGAL